MLDILQTDDNKTYLVAKKNSSILTVEDFNKLTDKNEKKIKMISNPLIEYVLESQTDKNENIIYNLTYKF